MQTNDIPPFAATLRYLSGDATRPAGEGDKIIIHVCNDLGKWGKGFVLALSRRWMAPERKYREMFPREGFVSNPLRLGMVQFVEVELGMSVANMVAQHGIYPLGGKPPIRYGELRYCLETVAGQALSEGASVHCPRIGAGLAGGDWQVIERMLHDTLVSKGVDVSVYDLPGK